MHPFLSRINDFTNTNPLIRPIKWGLSDKVHRAYYHLVRMGSDKVRYQVHGMRRTGNHAIINWIIKGRGGPVIFCNDLDVGVHPAAALMKRLRTGRGEAAIISSYEDLPSSSFDLAPHGEWYGTCKAVHHILILRDPFNLFASRYVWKRFRGELFREDTTHRAEVIATWKDNARTYLQWQEQRAEGNALLHPVNYNTWVADPTYRDALGERLGLQERHAGLRETTNYGGGSSFEGMVSAATDNSRYLQRYVALMDDPGYLSIFADEELIRLSERIFGPIPHTDRLLENVRAKTLPGQ